MTRRATIRIRQNTTAAQLDIRESFVAAWHTGEYQGEVFDFETPAALFRLLTPKRWTLIETLQTAGPLGVRALARALGRDVRRVHDDATALLDAGLVERDDLNKLIVPFEEIRADFSLRRVAAA